MTYSVLNRKFVEFSKSTHYKTFNFQLYETVVVIDDGSDFSNIIIRNIEEVKEVFSTNRLNFIVLQATINTENEEFKPILNHLFPFIKNYELQNLSLNNFKQGFLFINGNDICFTKFKTISEPVINYYAENITVLEEVFHMPIPYEKNDIELDEETKQKIKAINTKIAELKETGKYIFILPIIEKFLEEEKKGLEVTDYISPVNIAVNLTITLPKFNNFEINFSTLTKCVYLLFLKHDDGIYLEDLKNYKQELLNFYKRLSNRNDFDKMILSIDKLVDTNTNEIYVHLSRIKSFFYKNFNQQIAEKYIIDGRKNFKKSISLEYHSIWWNEDCQPLF